MKRYLISCLFALALTGGFVIAAADSEEKIAAPPTTDQQAGDDDAAPAGKDEKKAATGSKEEKVEAAADNDEKPVAKTKNAGKKNPGLKLTTVDESELIKTLSYMKGYEAGKQLSQFSSIDVQLDEEALLAAFKDGFEGKEPSMTDKERKDVVPQLDKFLEKKQTAKLQELGEKNKAEGKTFLTENKKKEGIKTLPSGLQYKVLKSGKGESPKRSDTVRVHYRGKLLNGTEFDSSIRRGQPAIFPVGQVIPGWTEALQLMKVGDKWEIFIPSELAYAERGVNPLNGGIPPNATLDFEVELLGVEKGSRGAPGLK